MIRKTVDYLKNAKRGDLARATVLDCVRSSIRHMIEFDNICCGLCFAATAGPDHMAMSFVAGIFAVRTFSPNCSTVLFMGLDHILSLRRKLGCWLDRIWNAFVLHIHA